MPENVKSARLVESLEHLRRAHAERAYYNLQCKESENEWKEHVVNRVKRMHYSYDYAQQLHFPCSPQQTGPEL